MPKFGTNNTQIKKIPFGSVFKTEILNKLNKGAIREEQGQFIDYRTPLYASKAGGRAVIQPNTRISGVKGYVPADRAAIVEKFYRDVIAPTIKNPDFIQWEEKYYEYRHSSRSIRVPYSQIKESAIIPYFVNATKGVDPEVEKALLTGLNDGLKKLDATIPRGSLRLLSYEQAAERIPGTTNGGAPYFIVGKEVVNNKVVKDNRPLYIAEARKLAEQPLNDDIILRNSFWSIGRGQESNDVKDRIRGVVKPKQRRPGAEAHGGTIIGARMSPFLDKRADNPTRAALVSQRAVDEVISSHGKQINDTNGMVSGDGSSYDTHMMPWLAKLIGEQIVERFNCSPKDKQAMIKYFHHVFSDPLITPEGILWADHGMPSGTTFTNELDSCYNEVLVEAFKYLPDRYTLNCRAELTTVTDQGDDLVVIFQVKNQHPALKDPEVVKEILSIGYDAMNMSVNPKKQMVSREKCEYLKRLHTKGIRESYRSYIGTLIGMINMEHAKDGKGPMYTARGIMQAANHYSDLEGFDEFMKFVANGDEMYHLGITTKGGARGILQMAGGSTKVIKRLGYTSYTTHLGVDVNKGQAKLLSLSSAEGIERNKQ